MTSYCEVFARKEKKYRLNAQQCRFVLASLEGHMKVDSFGRTEVTSLYYDTPDRRLIARSLEKPLYKEKLRVRRYGSVEAGEANTDEVGFAGVGFGEAGSGEESRERVFIEIKKKYKGIVYKRRVACSVAAAHAYLSGALSYELACRAYPLASKRSAVESVLPRSIQISREIDQFLARYETLVPSMTIACSRVAYAPAGATCAGLRITFDTDLFYRDELKEGSSPRSLAMRGERKAFRPLLSPGEAIMEIKTASSMPMWLSRALSECGAYPSSFSKYGTAYCKVAFEERMASCA